jgi:hypothetical protein
MTAVVCIGSSFANHAEEPEAPAKYTDPWPRAMAEPWLKLENKSCDPFPFNSLTNPGIEEDGIPLPWKGLLSGKSGDVVVPLIQTFPDESSEMFLPESLQPLPR